jgi:phosphoribosyl 1,2-cyclic phosphodiesterase
MLFRGDNPNPMTALNKEYFDAYCTVSNLAIPSRTNSNESNPINNKNYRNNPSLLIQTSDGHTTIIDVGKTFREAALRWFPSYGISSIDAIILTHEHMDAAGGLDDVRGFQQYDVSKQMQHGQRPGMIAMPLYLSLHCYKDLQQRFPWLLPKPSSGSTTSATGSLATALAPSVPPATPVVHRHVASFDVETFRPFEPFVLHSSSDDNTAVLEIIPLPVMHGEDLISFGFAFTIGSTNVVYLSDISRMLHETLDYIQNKLGPTDVLIVDALHETETNAVHYSLQDALQLIKLIRPRRQTYLVGMSCDSFLPHDDMNALLQEKYGKVALAHDGLEILV